MRERAAAAAAVREVVEDEAGAKTMQRVTAIAEVRVVAALAEGEAGVAGLAQSQVAFQRPNGARLRPMVAAARQARHTVTQST